MAPIAPKQTNLRCSLDYLAWDHIAGAVLDVFRENQQREDEQDAIKASADSWSICSGLRQQVWERARENWCVRTELGREWFPYNEDATSRIYYRCRKRNEEELAGFQHEIALASLQH